MLSNNRKLTHPFVIGELACGNLPERSKALTWFRRIPGVPVAHPSEVMALIESKRLFGRGLGWIDVNLIAAALLDGCALWTLDNALRQAAADSGVRAHSPTITKPWIH